MSRAKGRDLVIWIDDAQVHLQHGLTRDNLRRVVERYPKLIVVMTIHSSNLEAIKKFDSPLHALLRQPFDDLILKPVLSPSELADAKAAYPGLADEDDLERLPELFAAVNDLTDRYQSHWTDQPVGTAVAKAAIDWQRAGKPPGSIDRPTLRALTDLTLPQVAPNRIASDDDFEAGLKWSTTEVAAFAALVRREPTAPNTVERFRAFDAVVTWSGRHHEELTRATWDFVLERAGSDRLDVGVAAYQAGERSVARKAFERVAQSEDGANAPLGALNLGILRWEQDPPEIDAAKVAYQQAIDSHHPDASPAAAVNLGVLLAEQGEIDAAKDAYRQAIDSHHPDQSPMAARNVGFLLAEQGEIGPAKVAYQQAIDSHHPDQSPAAAFSLGSLLAEQGESGPAKVAYQQAIDSHHPDQSPAAAYNLGNLLKEQGEIDAAKDAYEQAIAYYHPDHSPAAAFNLGNLLKEQGEMEAAKKAYQWAIAEGGFRVAGVRILKPAPRDPDSE